MCGGAARGCPARGGRPGRFSRARSPWVRCCGSCSPADAGLLTWWRRRAQRAPARQGSACRPPRSRRGLPDPVRLWRQPGRAVETAQEQHCRARPGLGSRTTGRSSPPRGLTGCSPSIAWPPDQPPLDARRGQLVDDDVAVMVAVKITPLDFVRLARSGKGRVYQAQ